jgi:alkylation response protein AidB-like acyl-CoA dehydrogenase
MATETRDVQDQSKRREQLLELTAQLSDDFATRAAQHDREGSYPFENVQRMRETGYLSLTVPESFGGLGAGMVDMMQCLERMAGGCGSTALAVALHASYLG